VELFTAEHVVVAAWIKAAVPASYFSAPGGAVVVRTALPQAAFRAGRL